jgi:NAD(P)-dependent dehydrogenase (short-subunit alcohol dehydrogenase family)
MDSQVILITGASSGIGAVCAEHLQRGGHKVYGAGRRFQNQETPSFETVEMDVNADAQVQDGVRRIAEKEGRLDVVINNAGFGIEGAIEETSIEEAKALFETNFFGTVRVCQAVLPSMRQQRSGLIINISSIGGLISIPFQGFYSASKFAIEGMTEALRTEVLSFGIRVVLVEPGDFKTPFRERRRQSAGSEKSTAYSDGFDKVLAAVRKDEMNGHDPAAIARLVERIIANPSPKLRYTVGPPFQRLSPRLKAVFPHKLTEWLTLRYFKLS